MVLHLRREGTRLMQFRVVTVLLLTVAVLLLFASLPAAKTRSSAEPSLIYTVTPHYEVMAWLKGGDRFPAGTKLVLKTDKGSRALIPEFFASADASVSFDGTKILFSGRKTASDPWQIWELSLGGGEPRRVGLCVDCVRPFYLPDDRVVYAHKMDGRFQVEAASTGGGEPLLLTHVPGNALPTDVLRDGRILFESAFPLGDGAKPELYTVYSDGSGIESYRCDHGSTRHSGKQIASGDILFAKDEGLSRFTSALAREVQVAGFRGEFTGDVVESSAGEWIVSRRTDAKPQYSLQVGDLRAGALRPLVAEAGSDVVQPILIAPRTIPNRHPSALHDWHGANLLCLNAYTSKLKLQPGEIKAVQVYALANDKPLLLGRAEVEKDGSFFLHVPSDQPLQMELLDASGKTLQREHGWFWMRRGEQRVCVGCHAGPERAPENAVPEVLLKSTDPTDLTTKTTANGGR
jgi:hypothetical protein